MSTGIVFMAVILYDDDLHGKSEPDGSSGELFNSSAE